MGQMALTGLAVAASPAALSAKGDQTGSDKRAFDFELPEAGVYDGFVTVGGFKRRLEIETGWNC